MKRLILTIAFLAICGLSLADSLNVSITSGTVTATRLSADGQARIVVDWVSDGDGDVVATLTDNIGGELRRVVFDPDEVTSTPTALYDVTLTDRNSVDVLATLGSNLSSGTTTSIVPFIGNGTTTNFPFTVCGALTLTVDNAGDTKAGEIVLYLKP